MSYITPRKTTIPIYQGDDLERLGELRRAADQIERQAKAKLIEAEKRAKSFDQRAGDDESVTEARAAYDAAVKPSRDAYDAFVDEAAERACMVELRAIGSKRFRELMVKHSPRMVELEGDDDEPAKEVEHEDDAPFGVNTETFPRALLTYIDERKRTIAEPSFPSEAAVADFLDDEVEDGDIALLWTAAYYLNRQPSADPKASRFSPAPQSSPAT